MYSSTALLRPFGTRRVKQLSVAMKKYPLVAK